jgi:hypothetical protein
MSGDIETDVEISDSDVVEGSVDVLELNLLHAAWSFRFDPLRLNKSGAPNRRSLLRHARGIVMPGMRREIGEEADLSDPEQIDYLAFVLAVSLELGTLVVDEEASELRADTEAMETFFTAGPGTRTRRLYDAVRRLRFWNELRSHVFWETQSRDEEHLSLLEPTGERLIGARGAVFSVIKKLAPDGWVLVEDLAHSCRDEANDYFESVLEDEVATLSFVHAVVRRAMQWAGFVNTGKTAEGHPAFELGGRGRAAFGLESIPETAPTDKGLVVQPNLEITAMLDATPVEVLHGLYRVAERRRLADRVATFALSARTVQRGYAAGASADDLTELLRSRGVTPLPDSVAFQLQDWERMHRRVAVYADGILFRHSDPDQLDMLVGQLSHDNPDVEFVRLGPSITFAADTELEGLDRAIKRGSAFDVDYLGTLPPPLEFVDPLVVRLDPVACDMITLWEIERIGEMQGRPKRTERVYELVPDKMKERWPDDPFHEAVAFLEPRFEEGIPAAQYLKLRSVLDKPTRASMESGVTVLTIDSAEDADRLGNAPEVNPFIVKRLGDRTFAVDSEREKELLDVLHAIGIRGGSLDA